MDKGAIKKFAINARKRLIDSVKDKAGSLGITEKECTSPIQTGEGFEVYKTQAGTENKIYGEEIVQRRNLVRQIQEKGYENIVEEVAYTWFNRIIAIRFMEVNDYLPTRVRVLSSENEGKIEPDIINEAPDVDLDFTSKDVEYIISCKSENKSDELFRFLFIKQCESLGEILPELFKKTKDYTEMLLNISYINEDDVIRMLVDNVSECDFDITNTDENGEVQGQVEIIGWLYQYYNTELKDDTFAKLKKNIKIAKERIPAATQLFTPDWIVKYMVENSLGRLWIEHLRTVDDTVDEKETAENFGWKYYLPEAEQEEEVNVQLTEIRKSYKDLTPQDISCIDPCMGSGHILIYMFDVLMDIYKSEGFNERDAAFYIIENNINGIDIDERAHQLAYFAVLMKARSYNRRLFNGRKVEQEGKEWRVYPSPNLYAIEESNSLSDDLVEQLESNFKDVFTNNELDCIQYVIDVFKDAKEYGSILNIDSYYDRDDRQYATVALKLYSLYSDTHEYCVSNSMNLMQIDLLNEVFDKLDKLLIQAQVMCEKYDVVVTNPPYMGNSGMGKGLSDFVKKNYPDSKSDLFAVFIEKSGLIAKENGFYALITQPSLTSLVSFQKLREKLFQTKQINSFLHMGRGIFGIDFGSVSFVYRNCYFKDYIGNYFKLYKKTFQFINPEDIEKLYLYAKTGALEKYVFELYDTETGINIESRYDEGEQLFYRSKQDKFMLIPGCPLAYSMHEKMINCFSEGLLGDKFVTREGMTTAGNDDYLRLWYEVKLNDIAFNSESNDEAMNTHKKWFPYNKGGDYRKWFGNNDYVVNWENDGEKIRNNKDTETGRIRSHNYNGEYAFKKGLTWSSISSGNISVRWSDQGFLFDSKGAKGFSEDDNKMYAIQGLINSAVAMKYLEFFSPTMDFKVGDIILLPLCKKIFESEELIKLVMKNIRILENDWNARETSWDFIKHPLITYKAGFGYKESPIEQWQYKIEDAFNSWKDNAEMDFNQLKSNEEELNKIFIDIYGLQDELTPEVEDKDVTIRKADLGKDIRSFISYAVGCMFGRYSLDYDGLMFVGPEKRCEFFERTNENYSCRLRRTCSQAVLDYNLDNWDMKNKKVRKITEHKNGTISCEEWIDATYMPCEDNVIPITDEDYFNDDIVRRFVEFVKTVYGEETLEENLIFIADALGNKGNSSRESIRNYFIKDFYKDHVKIYQKRPIYWLFDSGKENGFKALIYMHRYDKDTVGKVRTEYLHKTQLAIENGIMRAEHIIASSTNAREKAQATKDKNKYIKQLAETRIYDEAIAHIANKRIEIDLDDGVKVNYEKFQGVEVSQEGKKTVKIDLLAKL